VRQEKIWAIIPTWQTSASICEVHLELCLSYRTENSKWASSDSVSCFAVAELVSGYPFLRIFFFDTLP
jgi:hypothetical protein